MVDDGIKLLNEKLETPGYLEVNCKWKEYKSLKGHPPNWYNITEPGCKSIRQMANKIGKKKLYDVVYSYYSMYAHGSLALINHNYENEQLRITPLRSPHILSLICRNCLSLAADVYYHFVMRYLGEEDRKNLDVWYIERRQEIKLMIADEEAINVKR